MEEKSEVGEVEVERLDEIPVVIGLLLRMRIQAILDENIEVHGNWQGLSPGWVVVIWIAHILTQHNHCLDRVQAWVSKRITILRLLTGQPVTELDFTDDRLALCLEMLSQTRNWHPIEAQLSSHLVRVYRLPSRIVRLDATTATVNHDPQTHELFQIGKAKNGQYEVQFKLMLASLDPLGLPLVVDVVSGERADDPLYLPCYQRVKQVLSESGLLIVGDSKMSALQTRATIVAGEDYYLTPLAHLKDEPGLLDELLTPWRGRADDLELIFLPEDLPADGSPPDPKRALGRGFEVRRTHAVEVAGEWVKWEERLEVVCSFAYAQSMQSALDRRLEKAEKALRALTPLRQRGKRQIEDEASLLAAIQHIEDQYQVHGFFSYDAQQEVQERKVRAYGDKPAYIERKVRFQLTVTRNEETIQQAEAQLGWRIYATNARPAVLSLSEVVLAYRDQYIEENIFRRLKGKILSINPLYIQRDDHAKGLFHLLTLASRLLALADYVAKQSLAQQKAVLAGIFPGNPKRSTPTPTTERMLAAFYNIHLLVFCLADQTHYQVTPLSDVQQRILGLLDLPVTLYTHLSLDDSRLSRDLPRV